MQPLVDEVPAGARQVACPACGKRVPWLPQNAYRPFCSARCKGIDLGAWASGSYRIAGADDAPGNGPGAAA